MISTQRLFVRPITVDDAPFILTLLNEPSFIRYIGDKSIRDVDAARQYILSGPMASYDRHGFGLNLVELKESQTPIGICGLLKRDELPDPDIGFALVPDFWSKGFAFEAATAVLQDARARLSVERILAITSLDNEASINLLERLGFKFEKVTQLTAGGEQVRLFTV